MALTEKAPTLREVAREADVHVATASRALNETQAHLVNQATRERVHAAAERLGYRTNALARSLRRGKTGMLGIVVADFSNTFIVTLFRGIEQETREHALLPLVVETRDDPAELRSAVTRLLDNRVDAIIMAAAHLTDEEFVREVARSVPLVLAVRGFDTGSDHAAPPLSLEVMQDDYQGARSAVRHLLQLGHRRIAQLPGAEDISSFVNRGRGFSDEITSWTGANDVSSGMHAIENTVAEGRRLTAELLRRPAELRPTAIFAHNDLMAVGALDALKEVGLRCPEDLSIVGYNDAPLVDHLDPPLATVRMPSWEIGRHSARLALAAIAGEQPPATRFMLLPEFVERKSTGAIEPSPI